MEEKIEVYPNIYSSPIYVMTTWVLKTDKKNPDKKIYEKGVGYYPTHERAVCAMNELADACIDYDEDLEIAIIRKKAVCMQLPCDFYLEEWIYQYCILYEHRVRKENNILEVEEGFNFEENSDSRVDFSRFLSEVSKTISIFEAINR